MLLHCNTLIVLGWHFHVSTPPPPRSRHSRASSMYGAPSATPRPGTSDSSDRGSSWPLQQGGGSQTVGATPNQQLPSIRDTEEEAEENTTATEGTLGEEGGPSKAPQPKVGWSIVKRHLTTLNESHTHYLNSVPESRRPAIEALLVRHQSRRARSMSETLNKHKAT